MSDVFCNACGKYHASLTVCPNENIVDTRHTPPLCRNCVAVTSLEAEIARLKAILDKAAEAGKNGTLEIARLKAREAEMREALEEIMKRSHMANMDGTNVPDEEQDVWWQIANRSLLSRESAEPAEDEIEAAEKWEREWCENCGCMAEAPKPAEERGPEYSCEHSFQLIYRCVHCGQIGDSIA
jgi:hypothetical protein